MTTDQAVNRQADHENLIRELVNALREAIDIVSILDREENFPRSIQELRAILAKAKEQGYA